MGPPLMQLCIVKASCNHEADVWQVDHTDVQGLATEAATFEALCRKMEVMAPKFLELNGLETAEPTVRP